MRRMVFAMIVAALALGLSVGAAALYAGSGNGMVVDLQQTGGGGRHITECNPQRYSFIYFGTEYECRVIASNLDGTCSYQCTQLEP